MIDIFRNIFSKSNLSRINIGRFLIGFVLLVNLQCALSFIIAPGDHAPAFELSGISGEAAIRGFGVLFIMWNIPYIIAFIHPVRFRISLFEAIGMQFIGLTGEILILLGLTPDNDILSKSIQRFVIFDAVGLICLVSAALLQMRKISIFHIHH